jgi:flagellar assembly protein FliH
MMRKSAVMRGQTSQAWRLPPLQFTAPEPAAPMHSTRASVAIDIDALRDDAMREVAIERQHLLAQARAEAQQIVSEAEAQRDAFVAAARAEGHETAEEGTRQVLLTAQGVLDEVRVWQDQIRRAAERDVIDLIKRSLTLILGEIGAPHPDALKAAFQRALNEARPLGALRVHLHPEDAELLGPHWPEQMESHLGQTLVLVPDSVVHRGGCLIEGEHGSVDARIETQATIVADALDQAVQR